jgi:hypothetical protein
MKAKVIMVLFSFLILTGCCSNGCGTCGGCDVGYWSTSCPVPNSGGASEAAFTDIANVCQDGSGCARSYYSAGCNSGGCNSSTNW